MSCEDKLHDELKEAGIIECPFCDFQFIERKPLQNDKCCDCQDIINDNGKSVCQSCGIVGGFGFVNDRVNFYESRYRFRRKYIYHRKYHIKNKIFEIRNKYGIMLNGPQREAIEKVFEEIGKIAGSVNKDTGRKRRLININFMIRNLIILMLDHELEYEKIPISKSKKNNRFSR